jgi:putative NIF3 family GTP cyclohydrolase 1 type 2
MENTMAKTVQDIIDLIMHEVTDAPLADTVDTLKTGDPAWPVTGIVTSFMSTLDVLRQASAIGANFIITHEPTFYNHLDQVDWLKDDAVYQAKRQYLTEKRLAVWRFHDHWHRYRPDGIMTGLVKQLGWEGYRDAPEGNLFTLPPMPLAELAALLRDKLGVSSSRVIGSANMTCRRAALMPGSPPGGQVEVFRQVDVLISGEAPEWQIYEYVRDAIAAGQSKAMIMLGHERTEEPGMAYLAEWLAERLPGLPITHISSGEPVG